MWRETAPHPSHVLTVISVREGARRQRVLERVLLATTATGLLQSHARLDITALAPATLYQLHAYQAHTAQRLGLAIASPVRLASNVRGGVTCSQSHARRDGSATGKEYRFLQSAAQVALCVGREPPLLLPRLQEPPRALAHQGNFVLMVWHTMLQWNGFQALKPVLLHLSHVLRGFIAPPTHPHSSGKGRASPDIIVLVALFTLPRHT
mmetsp:Transcript_5111/g.11589  ORF Transcript_5111/g.11589 Transcript_5111/m.11589 type:complete len:208 (+) Transcript_5111:2587-3210(+)